MIALARQPTQLAEEEAAQRGVVGIVEFDIEAMIEVGDGRGAFEGDRAVLGRRLPRLRDRVVFVVDLADDFLQQVFHRHQPGSATILVEDHREVGLEPLHIGQHILHFAGPGDEERLA